VTGGKPIAVLLQPISGVSVIDPLRKRCYSFILSRTPHETLTVNTLVNITKYIVKRKLVPNSFITHALGQQRFKLMPTGERK
jgi:hypothetical protein